LIKDIREKNENVKPNSREIEVLKNNFPACFDKDGNFDIDKFKSTISTSVDITEENYGLNFLGKNYAKLISALDTETVIEPDKKHNKLAGNKDSKNLYITGDNLDVLKHLTKSYAGSIDVIYIDPPYNTGNDGFVYNDRFKYTADELVEKLNISEDRANKILDFTSKGSASHSAWLSFMYPRLYIARDLLSDNGVIFISIDDNEQAQLKLLCDDVFSEENFIANLIWAKNSGNNNSINVSIKTEYVLVYGRNKDQLDKSYFSKRKESFDDIFALVTECRDKGMSPEETQDELRKYYSKNKELSNGTKFYKYIDDNYRIYGAADLGNPSESASSNPEYMYDLINPNTNQKCEIPKRGWLYKKDKMLKNIDMGLILFTEGTPRLKRYLDNVEYENISSLQINNDLGNRDLEKIINTNGVFSYPKPVSLIKNFINCNPYKDITVLDFFSGSGTTGQAVMELNAEDGGNRKFILVQLPEAVESKEYKTIDEIGRKRIELSAQKIKKEHPEYTGDLGFKHYTVKEVDADTIANMEEFDPNKNVVNIGDVITDDTIITTWLCADGYGIDADVCKIDLAGYSAYMCENHLYLIDAGFKEEHLNALMKRIIEDPEFNIKYIVLFGYNFNDWSINEMMEKNTKVIKNSNKALNIDILTRF